MKISVAYLTLDPASAPLDEEHFSEFSRLVEFSSAIEPTPETDLHELFALLGDRCEQYMVLTVTGEPRDYVQYLLTRNTGLTQLSHLELFLSDRFNAPVYVREAVGTKAEPSYLAWDAIADSVAETVEDVL